MKKIIPLRDGQHLKVRVVGKGKPVLLLHGFGSESRHWYPNVLPLSYQYQFILPDLRGFGQSHHIGFSHDNVFVNYAQDIEDILNHLDVPKVILGGLSTGAYSCLMYNKLHGFDRVERYLNIEHSTCSLNQGDVVHGLFREQQDSIFAGFGELADLLKPYGNAMNYWQLPSPIRLQLRDTMTDLFVRAVHHGTGKKLVSSARYVEKALAGNVFPIHNLPVYLTIMQAFMKGEDTTSALSTVKAPISIMAGQQSEYFSLQAQQHILQHAPVANLTIFRRAGHIPIVDRPIAFQKEFARFLTQPIEQFRNKAIRYV